MRIVPAAIGRAAPRARRWLAISIARGCETMQRRGRGIHRILHGDQMAAAVRTICAAPAATGCSIVSRPNRGFWTRGSGVPPTSVPPAAPLLWVRRFSDRHNRRFKATAPAIPLDLPYIFVCDRTCPLDLWRLDPMEACCYIAASRTGREGIALTSSVL